MIAIFQELIYGQFLQVLYKGIYVYNHLIPRTDKFQRIGIRGLYTYLLQGRIFLRHRKHSAQEYYSNFFFLLLGRQK